ncbi:MAG: hypothetical protein ABI821_10500 [Pseudomonadota bacterium]
MFEWSPRTVPWNQSDATLIEIDTGAPPPPPPALRFEPPATLPPPVVLELPAPADSNESASINDWLTDGAVAAAAVGGLDGTRARSFGTTERAPGEPRKVKPFGWDKTQTQRLEVIPGIGTRIRLTDHCEVFVTLIPMVGCSLGKIPARGDLFEGMDAPVKPGD